MTRPEIDELLLADPPALWRGLGLAVGADGVAAVGGVRLRLGAPGAGIVGLTLRGLPAGHGLGHLGVGPSEAPPPEPADHPLGVTAVDHVVLLTPDLDATVVRLRDAGLDLRRIREAGGGVRQAFFLLGACLLEVAGPVDGPERLWGVTLVAQDLDAVAARLGDRLGTVRDAVQPARRIATLRREAGSGVPVAFITPRV